MLLPREKPFLNVLNSYYLDVEKFIQHLQGEIGTGCLYGKGANQEILVYFDEYEVVRGVTQENGEPALVSDQLDHVMMAVAKRNFQVAVYYLDPDSIFFWGQMPAFRRAKAPLSSTRVSLPDLVFRLNKKSFSGFIELDVQKKQNCAVLFFHQGVRRGGSYYWGRGGLSPSDDDYNTLLGMLQKSNGSYSLGYFTSDPTTVTAVIPETKPEEQQENTSVEENEEAVQLNRAINEFMEIFLAAVGAKTGTDPLVDLKLKFI
ncbi:MAG: hypothetical protein D3923_04300, partial [Candidatus Electrothrix sp. AR3]|nr:hypothetical protein [Candidatus Electrothrix sp. AR3]